MTDTPGIRGIQDTSLDAYLDPGLIVKHDRQRDLIEGILDVEGPLTDREICDRSGLQINAVTGRRNEMARIGMIVRGEKRRCTITGRTVYTWRLNIPGVEDQRFT